MAEERVNRELKLLSWLVIGVGITLVASTLLLHLQPVQHYTSGLLETLRASSFSTNKQHGQGGQKNFESNGQEDKLHFSDVRFKNSGGDTADDDPLTIPDEKAPFTDESDIRGTSSSKLVLNILHQRSFSSPSPETNHSYSAFENYTATSATKNEPTVTVRENTVSTATREESNSSQSEEEEHILEEMVRERFILRKKYLEARCSAYGDKVPSQIVHESKQFFYYAKKYQLLACVSAKGGATTWKTHFLIVNGYNKPFSNPHSEPLHKWIRARDVIGENFLEHLSKKAGAKMVMSVRHPFSRLVSAYTDKYGDGKPVNVTKSRRMFFETPLKMMGRNFTVNEEVAVPFPLFLRFVLYQRSTGFDRHWVPYSNNCKPCGIPYDYIVHLETLDDDLRYIVHHLGIKEIDVTMRKNKSVKGKGRSLEEYFKGIPPGVIRAIFTIYREDFYLFGYDVPQFVKDAFSNSSGNPR
ncbi:carbohydrate sulfotransferase 9-like [Macrobrachium nipponense]|uniref:carbohydrate sulfotransferase 9-like n=1 Tax=Macrobrachium nipponense TaxID=159736 RepID=UPI0030C7D736